MKKLTLPQFNVLNEISEFGISGGIYVGKTTQVEILIERRYIRKIGVSKFAVTWLGCEATGINYRDAIDAIHEVALIENTLIETPAEDETLAAELPAVAEAASVETETIAHKYARLAEEAKNSAGCNCGGAFNEYGRCVCPDAQLTRKAQPAPTMQSSLIKAKDDHIAQLEARVKELEAENAALKSNQMSDLEAARFGLFIQDNYGSLEEFIEREEAELPFEEENQNYNADLGLGR